MGKVSSTATNTAIADESGGIPVGGDDFTVKGPVFPLSCMGDVPAVAGLRPKQVRAAIMLVVLGFNFLGDGLRDVLDPRLRNL